MLTECEHLEQVKKANINLKETFALKYRAISIKNINRHC